MQPPCRSRALETAPRHGPVIGLILGTTEFSARRTVALSPLSNTPRRAGATSGNSVRTTLARRLFAFLAIMISSIPVAAQPASPNVLDAPAVPKVAAAVPDLAPPDARLALEAFNAVQSLIRDWKPGDTSPVVAGSAFDRASRACGAAQVTLRFGGRVVGRAWRVGGTPGALLATARDAMHAAEPFLHESGVKESVFASRLLVSLELAGALVPYAPASYDDADLEIPPGIDGVGARVDDTTKLIFPSSMLTHNTAAGLPQSPGDALAAAAAAALDDPVAGLRADPNNVPQKLAKDRKVQFYRFSVTHVSQPSPEAPATFLYRHGRVVAEREVTLDAMKQWGDGLADFVAARVVTNSTKEGEVAIESIFNPLGGTATRSTDPAVMSLAALALAERKPDQARTLLHAVATAAEKSRLRPAAAGAYLIAIARLSAAVNAVTPVSSDGIDRATTQAVESCEQALAQENLSLAERSLALAGLARRARTDAALRPRLDGKLAALLSATKVDQLASAMPWIIMAARDLTPPSPPDAPLAVAPLLGEWRDLAYKFVLTADDAGPDGEDLVGGMVFTKSRVPLPSAQTVRVAAGLAAMLADPRLTPAADRGKEIVRLVSVLRFTRQLMGDDIHATLFADPLRAKWGVRNALWDQRMNTDAAALALITLDEAIAGLEAKAGSR
ncbi:MAG: hypothetical protein K2Y21_09200 [Phycisphaerales bacterium]|nr:hypothetical protein [Phycisphaerales bacterium]